MARVIVSATSNVAWTKNKYHDAFVEGFMNALVRNGNDVLSIRCNDFLDERSELDGALDLQKIFHCLEAFRPDLVITFNNAFPMRGIIERLTCPIACFASDSFMFFHHRDELMTNIGKFLFCHFTGDTIREMPRLLPSSRSNSASAVWQRY